MQLLQKNYDAKTRDEKNSIPKVRVHVIDNPEILNEYLRKINRKYVLFTEDK
jgi:membrane-bound lytic murein transglycosylase